MANQADLLKEFDPLGSSEQSRSSDLAPSTAPPTEEVEHRSGAPKEVSPDHKQELPNSDLALTHSNPVIPHSDPVLLHSDPVIPHSDPVIPQASVGSLETVIIGSGMSEEGVKQHQEGVKIAATPQSTPADSTELPVPSPSSSGPASTEKKHRSHKHKKRSLRDKEKAITAQNPAPPTVPVAMAPLAPVPDLNLAQTQLEMMQIDSILQALSSGSFDSSSLAAISTLTSQPVSVCVCVCVLQSVRAFMCGCGCLVCCVHVCVLCVYVVCVHVCCVCMCLCVCVLCACVYRYMVCMCVVCSTYM